MSTDRRNSARMKTFLKGRVLFNNGSSSMDCLIRDLSPTGARLELSETAPLPEVFDLYVQHKDATFRSVLRWRRDDEVGVIFETAAKAASLAAEPSPPDASFSMLIRRVIELEAENAALRSLLATMNQPAASSAA